MTQSEAPEFDVEVDFVTGQPYPLWEQARRECPVFQSRGGMTAYTDRPNFAVTTYAGVEQVLRDTEHISSSINAEHIGKYMGELILAMDGKEHRAYRGLVTHAFRASQLEKWVSAPGDAHPFVEVQLREPHQLDELSLELAGAHEEPALTEASYLIECFAGEQPVWRLPVAGNLAPRPRHALPCPASDRVRVTFAPRDLARVYELELWGR